MCDSTGCKASGRDEYTLLCRLLLADSSNYSRHLLEEAALRNGRQTTYSRRIPSEACTGVPHKIKIHPRRKSHQSDDSMTASQVCEKKLTGSRRACLHSLGCPGHSFRGDTDTCKPWRRRRSLSRGCMCRHFGMDWGCIRQYLQG